VSTTAPPLPEIVLTGPIFEPGTSLLGGAGRLRQLDQPSPEEIDRAVRAADAAIVRIHRLTGETIRVRRRGSR